ncbi:MAG: hypothetical protein AB7F59_12755 [Bdellovibrionales bacterium]
MDSLPLNLLPSFSMMEVRENTKTYKRTPSVKPVRKKQVPATQDMLFEVRNELKSDIKRLDLKVGGLEKCIDGTEQRLETKIDGVEQRLTLKMDTQFYELKSIIHKLTLIVEEQNARNVYVLDGYANLYDRQDRLESRMSDFEKKWSK